MNVTDESPDRLACLMRSAQDGDGAAYAALLREVLPALRSLVRARRRFMQASDIEDIVQDILLSLHAVRATYDPRRPFKPWLHAIAYNRIADSGRRHYRQAANSAMAAEHAETFAAAETNDWEETYGDPEALRQAIAHLPAGQRQAIEAVKLKEMSLREASEATGMSVSALKVAVHRGIRSLRLTLDSRG
jgi:RNA polymerase sigma-70 factor (ECF subfamily)